MQLPESLKTVLDALRLAGCRPRLVGGCVRDWILGQTPKDIDIEVLGTDFENLHRTLSPYGATDIVGRSFGVIKLRLDGVEYDFSLPRRESKIGAGHRGFYIRPDPTLSPAEAAARRDFTINAIACDPFTGDLTDPHGGIRDLEARILRHTSDAFAEDPLRVLRAMQFAARFRMTLAPETARLCAGISASYEELPLERVWGEWDKWATQSVEPSRGMRVLVETGWLQHYPEISALRGTPQEPDWHPEGDVLTHTNHCMDALTRREMWATAPKARRRLLLLAVLAHDFGKPMTTQYAERHGQMRWISPEHESAGGPLTETFLQRIGAPKDLIEPARALVVNHLIHHHGKQAGYSDTQIRRLARRLIPATIDDLCEVMTADACGRPPINPTPSLVLIAKLRSRAQELTFRTEPPRPLLLGRHLLARGMQAGPHLKPLLEEAFEAQLDGAFSDEAGAMKWLEDRFSECGATEKDKPATLAANTVESTWPHGSAAGRANTSPIPDKNPAVDGQADG